MAKFNKSETKMSWEYDENKVYKGEHLLTWIDRSPISGAWQIPARCLCKEPPPQKEGYQIVYNHRIDNWEYKQLLSLEETKEKKLEELKKIRNNLEVEPIPYKGYLFDFDEEDRERLRLARTYLNDNRNIETIKWTVDIPIANTSIDIDISLQDFINLNNIAAERSTNVHNIYRQLKEVVANATTVEEVNNITWPSEAE